MSTSSVLDASREVSPANITESYLKTLPLNSVEDCKSALELIEIKLTSLRQVYG